jgi:hypothetical protein
MKLLLVSYSIFALFISFVHAVPQKAATATGLFALLSQLKATGSLPPCFESCLPADPTTLCANPASSFPTLSGCLMKGCSASESGLFTNMIPDEKTFAGICAQAVGTAVPANSNKTATTAAPSAAKTTGPTNLFRSGSDSFRTKDQVIMTVVCMAAVLVL